MWSSFINVQWTTTTGTETLPQHDTSITMLVSLNHVHTSKYSPVFLRTYLSIYFQRWMNVWVKTFVHKYKWVLQKGQWSKNTHLNRFWNGEIRLTLTIKSSPQTSDLRKICWLCLNSKIVVEYPSTKNAKSVLMTTKTTSFKQQQTFFSFSVLFYGTFDQVLAGMYVYIWVCIFNFDPDGGEKIPCKFNSVLVL